MIGKKLAEYNILKELGRGGMGAVYLAVHTTLSRSTAIKILPLGFTSNKMALEKFIEEAKFIAKFNHPNIVPIYSVGNEEGVYFIAMGYVSGHSLQAIIKNLQEKNLPQPFKATVIKEILQISLSEDHKAIQKNISLERDPGFWDKTYFQFVATIGSEIADALKYAHQNNIVHGDLKPSNIMLTNEAIPMVVDFGLAKDFVKTPSLNRFCGTYAYAAPEQIINNIVNDKTDLWSLGVILYELLTFRNPFVGRTVGDTVTKIKKGNPPPLRAFKNTIPLELEAIVLKCLEVNPSNRYTSTSELGDDLRNYLELKPIKAKPVNLGGRIYKWSKRHPALTKFVVIFLMVSILSGYLLYAWRVNRLLVLGQELQSSGHSVDAEKIYQRILKESMPIPPMKKMKEKAFLGLGQIYAFNKEPEKSISYFRECLNINPYNIDALSGIKNEYEDLKNYTEAIKYYERIAKLSLSYFRLSGYPRLLHKIGQVDKALEVYKSMLEYNPNDKYVLVDYAKFLREIDRLEDAMKILAKFSIDEMAEDAIAIEVHAVMDEYRSKIEKATGESYENYRLKTVTSLLNDEQKMRKAFDSAVNQNKAKKEKWGRIKSGMSRQQVKEILGEPSNDNCNIIWEYPYSGKVEFDSDHYCEGSVIRWQEL